MLYSTKQAMSLDFVQVAAQIEDMAAELKASEKEREERFRYALETLHSQAQDLESLKGKIGRSKTTWLVAGLSEGLNQGFQPDPGPEEFLVLACDGSHIDVDRHSPARCYLINTGSVILHYGDEPDAILESRATLYAGEQDLSLADPVGSRAEPVEGALLGAKRAIEECRALADLVTELPPNIPLLALLDGSLILWGLAGQAHADFVKNELLNEGFLKVLDKMGEAGRERTLALASYISLPRSTEVVNALRVAICPDDPVDCDRHCPGRGGARDCDAVASTEDRNLFGLLLRDGERSPIFTSLSSIVRNYYREHEVHFFYLKADDEIARVEFPRWVLERGLVGLVHALVLDQCQRGQGYPVALSEAHEKAVISGAEREQFQQLVELALSERGLPATSSAKNRSKRTRWI